ncbi:CRISPR-associated DxTHG motif protein [Vulcanisaeta distributa]|uniref:CRISPR-associated protein DxTHG motif protein n=1 Tax=Vulcanisaeta distributa (strain DSM 14429 / JCM 11212 / NBRC 100878 / IC-017) TaxID=572478 RepID=E1QQW3_VULDI|nr:TM1812 family CRISPR-associated protein [Vulcanisaeta distributa]ADN50533.1 CRISPR-associated protein DxTHG motif protein [Vulcanisaeta distributa DSM 14429]
MGGVKRVYIATWGNPLEWRAVSYKCTDEDLCGSRERECRDTYSSIKCMSNADIYVIYVLDSVITASAGQQNPKAVECARKYSLCANNECSKLAPPSRVGDLSGWRDLVKGYIECIVRELLGDTRNVRVVVTSLRGRLGDWEFAGGNSPDLIASELLVGLWNSIKDLITDDERLYLFLDVTHGINFMPTLTYQMTRYIATLALIKGAGEVFIRVYNALPGSFEVIKLIYENMRQLVLPQEVTDEVVKALSYGALAVIPKVLSRNGACRENHINFQVDAEINHGERKVKYEHKGDIKPYNVYSKLIEEVLCGDNVFRQAVGRGGVIKLRDLMNHRLIDKLSDVARVVIQDELNDMYNAISKAVNLGLRVYDNYYSDIILPMCHEGFPRQCKCVGKEDMRNFIAHAGLLKNCTKIVKCDDDYCIAIDDEVLKCLK